MTDATKGYFFIYQGTSGAMRKQIAEEVAKRLGLPQVIKVTTRDPKPTEVNGIDRHFVSRSEFAELEANQAFIQTVVSKGEQFGILKEELESALQPGKSAYLTSGDPFAAIQEQYGDRVVYLFISLAEQSYVESLRNVGESEETIALKLEKYKKDLAYRENASHAFVNDDFERTVDRVHAAVMTYLP